MSGNVKNECVKRLNTMINQGLLTDLDVVGMYKNGELCVSEANMVFGQPCGVIMNLKNKPSYYNAFMKYVKNDIQGEPYFVMAQNTSFGLMMSVLYVSNREEQWDMEREMLEEKNPFAYVYNMDEEFLEVGSIRYEMINGGPIRTA